MRSAHAKGSGTEYKVYQLSGTAKLHLQIGDLTEWSGDAIVNAGTPRNAQSNNCAHGLIL